MTLPIRLVAPVTSLPAIGRVATNAILRIDLFGGPTTVETVKGKFEAVAANSAIGAKLNELSGDALRAHVSGSVVRSGLDPVFRISALQVLGQLDAATNIQKNGDVYFALIDGKKVSLRAMTDDARLGLASSNANSTVFGEAAGRIFRVWGVMKDTPAVGVQSGPP